MNRSPILSTSKTRVQHATAGLVRRFQLNDSAQQRTVHYQTEHCCTAQEALEYCTVRSLHPPLARPSARGARRLTGPPPPLEPPCPSCSQPLPLPISGQDRTALPARTSSVGSAHSVKTRPSHPHLAECYCIELSYGRVIENRSKCRRTQ